jgi:hypothetical protein
VLSARVLQSCSPPNSSFGLNLKTAKSLGLEVADRDLLVAADEVTE